MFIATLFALDDGWNRGKKNFVKDVVKKRITETDLKDHKERRYRKKGILKKKKLFRYSDETKRNISMWP